MSEQNLQQSLAESISALVDNQASELELQRVLKASEKDPDVKATWARYQIMGAMLRGEQVSQSAIVLSDFAARVSASIAAEEQIIVIPAQKANHSWWHQLGRVALVASVAGGMIISVQQYNNNTIQSEVASTAGSTAIAPMISPLSLPSGINGPAINTRSVALQTGYETRPQENRRVMFQPRQAVVPNAPAATISEEELTRYVNQMIQAHSDNAALNSSQGVLPYARVIVTDE